MFSRAQQLLTALVLQRSLFILAFSQFIQFRSGTFPPLMGKVQLNNLILSKLRITINRLLRNYNLFSQDIFLIFLSETYPKFFHQLREPRKHNLLRDLSPKHFRCEFLAAPELCHGPELTNRQPINPTNPVDRTYLVAIRVSSKSS